MLDKLIHYENSGMLFILINGRYNYRYKIDSCLLAGQYTTKCHIKDRNLAKITIQKLQSGSTSMEVLGVQQADMRNIVKSAIDLSMHDFIYKR